jgi:hypothetical protein
VLFCVLVIAFIIAAKNTMTSFGFAAGAEVGQSERLIPGSAALSKDLAEKLNIHPGQQFTVGNYVFTSRDFASGRN